MRATRYSIGFDISTQTVTAALIGTLEEDGEPADIVIHDEWRAVRRYKEDLDRKSPAVWVQLVQECLNELSSKVPETRCTRGIGVSTTFPGLVAIDRFGEVDPRFVSLYDNTEDAGVCSGTFEKAQARAEDDTLNRMWPGNMAIGLVHLVKDRGLRIESLSAMVPPNTALCRALARAAGADISLHDLRSDLTQTVISGLYDARTGQPLPKGVRRLLTCAVPQIDLASLAKLLPGAEPSWRNVVSRETRKAVRAFLDLPELQAVSIGAGDSALGTLALCPGPEWILNVRGSSDTPVMIVDAPVPRCGAREVLLHYPMPTAATIGSAQWAAAAPILRTGRVWDWVRGLRFSDEDPSADAELERLALEALKRRETSAAGPTFYTALGGERAPDWNPHATGTLTGLTESHGIGEIALAALESLSVRLRQCLELMESRYRREARRLLLVGGPTKNTLWNWITETHTGKQTYATSFADASVVGAALLGYAASYDREESDKSISSRLSRLSQLCSHHPLICPHRIGVPD